MNFIEKNFKRVMAATGSAVGAAIVAVGTSVNISLLGGAILSGAFPAIAAAAVAGLIWCGVSDMLADVAVVKMSPIAWQVEVVCL
jgi:hypothetical protein